MILLDERLRLMAARENRLHLESLQQLRKGDQEEEKAALERSQKRKEVQKYQLAQVKRRQEEKAEMLEGKGSFFPKYLTPKLSLRKFSTQNFSAEKNSPKIRAQKLIKNFRTTTGRRRDETDN